LNMTTGKVNMVLRGSTKIPTQSLRNITFNQRSY
jgi:hypothetical protein